MKITLVSDTHRATPTLPGGDLLIHSGDLTFNGRSRESKHQLDWLSRSGYKKVIVVPGNHEENWEKGHVDFRRYCADRQIICLVEESIEIEGIKIFGSPITPEFCGWAYMKAPADIVHNWEKIPLDTDLLITHGPPRGILDTNLEGDPCGCPALRKKVAEVKPKLHVFGHIHEGYGDHTEEGTWFVNAAVMDRSYHPVNKPITFNWEDL